VDGTALPPVREAKNEQGLPMLTVIIPLSFERDEAAGIAPVEFGGRTYLSGDLYLDAQGSDADALIRSLNYVMRRLTELKKNPIIRLGLVPGGKRVVNENGTQVVKEFRDRWELLDNGALTLDAGLELLAERLHELQPEGSGRAL